MLASIGPEAEDPNVATISRDPASKKYRIHFCYGGKQFQKSLKAKDLTEAEAA